MKYSDTQKKQRIKDLEKFAALALKLNARGKRKPKDLDIQAE